MTVTIPLVLLLAAGLLALLRFRALGGGAAVVAVLFGFYLSSTDANGTINGLVSAITSAIPNLGS